VKIKDILKPEAIALNLSAETKKEALSKVLDLIKDRFTKIERGKILKILLEREKLSSTACDRFVAIPHARLDFIDYFVVAIGRFDEGLNFDSFDDQKTYLVFLLLGPKDKPGEYLKILAGISKLLKGERTKKRLLSTSDVEDFYNTIASFEES